MKFSIFNFFPNYKRETNYFKTELLKLNKLFFICLFVLSILTINKRDKLYIFLKFFFNLFF